MTEIIPAIDIMDGHCVRLTEGDYSARKTYDASPLDMVKQYSDCGVRRIHVVDLDGARESTPKNLSVLEDLASHTDVEIEWGGGISGESYLRSVFSAGASNAIIGSVAALHPADFSQWLRVFGGEKIILGADVRNGAVAIKGWQRSTELTLEDLIGFFLDDGLKHVISTEISHDGKLEGPAFEFYTGIMKLFPNIVFTASGGVSSMADVEKLDMLGIRRVIVGKAIYEGRIQLKEIEKWQLQNA